MLSDRRAFLRSSAAWPLVVISASLLPACQQASPDTPAAIKFGRDTCERCTMLISDPRFAAQVWSPDRKRFSLFDDMGCAVAFAVENGLIDKPEARLWAADSDDPSQWLDGRTSLYRCDLHTPMDYGFAATRRAAPGHVTAQEMRARVIEKAHCRPPDAAAPA